MSRRSKFSNRNFKNHLNIVKSMIVKMEIATVKHIVLKNWTDFLEETPQNNLKYVRKYIKNRRKKRSLALYAILNKHELFALKPEPKKNFVKTVGEMPNDVFLKKFHMEISTFKKLYNMLLPLWKTSNTGRPSISLKESLYVTLWKLENQNSFREISNRFNIGRGTAYRVFNKTIGMIAQLKDITIQFPTTELEQELTIQGFESTCSRPFPLVLGCIGCTHIRIMQPKLHGTSYYNREGTHSVVLQAIVNSEMMFTDVFVGSHGICRHDIVWKSSPLRRTIINNLISFPAQCHLLGGTDFPLETFLMVPYEDNGFLSTEQIQFNTTLNSTRMLVDQAFGILKKRFRILEYLQITNLELIKHIVMSCMVLHNIILKNEGLIGFDALKEENSLQGNIDIIVNRLVPEPEEAKSKRVRLTTLLSTKIKHDA